MAFFYPRISDATEGLIESRRLASPAAAAPGQIPVSSSLVPISSFLVPVLSPYFPTPISYFLK